MKYNLFLILLITASCVKKPTLQKEPGSKPKLIIPEESTFFSSAFVEQRGFDTPSDGDLWPSAWSDDGNLYAANGDGKGFDLNSSLEDIVVNRIYGHPAQNNITGERLAQQTGTIWGDTANYNRKPTGMVSVNGTLYLAVQDLNKTRGPNIFNEAPAATILRSDDKGKTWHWNKKVPMFPSHIFTTIMFLDYGQDSRNNVFDEYLYAYGLDNNWRDSFSDVVADPVQLYLARIPKNSLQNAKMWEFYTGDLQGNAQWSAPGNIEAKQPVLQDERRRYSTTLPFKGIDSLSVLSQGGIVYNKPLNRYIYTSWTEYTFEFYEAPAPWGPWKLFLSKDFGAYPWTDQNFGGYAAVIPSKFISKDGTEMWISSSTFAGNALHYNFSLRRLLVTPYAQNEKPSNIAGGNNLAGSQNLKEVTPIAAKSKGSFQQLNDRNKKSPINSYSIEVKAEDYWGYTWSKPQHMNKIIYTTGAIMQDEGGWFEAFKVQVRQNFEWITVNDLQLTPAYSFTEKVQPYTAYTLTFDETWGDGIRLVGKAGGNKSYTSICELEVYFEK